MNCPVQVLGPPGSRVALPAVAVVAAGAVTAFCALLAGLTALAVRARRARQQRSRAAKEEEYRQVIKKISNQTFFTSIHVLLKSSLFRLPSFRRLPLLPTRLCCDSVSSSASHCSCPAPVPPRSGETHLLASSLQNSLRHATTLAWCHRTI